ncbi:DapH/DapD/GlmU-related protein [Pseudomonas synxantha]|nr:DapH/DapD/GlmU-related protein [Pseudomonas synxantha]
MEPSMRSKYSTLDFFRLAWSFTTTKIFYSPARIIRQPTRIRGWENMSIGTGFTTGQYCRIEAANGKEGKKTLTIGSHVEINDACHIAALDSITIGNNVLIASQVYITDHDHGEITKEELLIHPNQRKLVYAPVVIEDDVWIGEKVAILKGVTVGKGSVIGAGAVVTKDVPPYSVAAGIPARILKTL